MNNVEQLYELISSCNVQDSFTNEDSMFINGCIELYKACNDQKLYERIKAYADSNIDQKPSGSIRLLRVLRFLWETSKEEIYKTKIEENMQYIQTAVRENGILHNENGTMMTAREAYDLFPVYAWYETTLNQKKNYLDIMNQLTYLNDQILVKNKIELYDRCTFMMALADTATEMSEEIYEYSAKIKSWLKEAVHKKLDVVNSDCLRVAYSVLKGCQCKALLAEKYEESGLEMLSKALDKLRLEGGKSKEEIGIVLMTSALVTTGRMEQAYGI